MLECTDLCKCNANCENVEYCENEKDDEEDSDGEEQGDNELENYNETDVNLEDGEGLEWFIDDFDNFFLWHFLVLKISITQNSHSIGG